MQATATIGQVSATIGQSAATIGQPSVFDCYDDLVDIKTVRLRDGVSRLENALYFLEQIKNPHLFRVGNDIVEVCCAGGDSLSDVLARHFNRKR